MTTITITFGDVAENHFGMQQIGSLAEQGFTLDELKQIKAHFGEGELIKLHRYYEGPADKAYLLVIRNGVQKLVEGDVQDELTNLTWDTKAKMRGRVVNKHARYNLCFSHESQEADFEQGKGTVVSFKDVPLLNLIRKRLGKIIPKCKGLVAEGNLYYDTGKCGIGFHGDGERNIVVAFRLGDPMPLHYQWYLEGERVGKRFQMVLEDGDLYFMSHKAVGRDWKKRKVPTLRHAAGCEKFTK